MLLHFKQQLLVYFYTVATLTIRLLFLYFTWNFTRIWMDNKIVFYFFRWALKSSMVTPIPLWWTLTALTWSRCTSWATKLVSAEQFTELHFVWLISCFIVFSSESKWTRKRTDQLVMPIKLLRQIHTDYLCQTWRCLGLA